MENNSFRNLVESLQRIDEGSKQGKAPGAQVKGNEKAKKSVNSEHPFKGRLVGEDDDGYGFLSKFVAEDELEEDLVSQMKREMSDYVGEKDNDTKPKQFNRPIKPSKKSGIYAKKGEKKLHSPEDPLIDSVKEDSKRDDHDQSTKPPFDGPYKKAGKSRKDKFGNTIKPKNVAKHLAKKGMDSVKEDSRRDALVRKAMKPITDKEKMFPKNKKEVAAPLKTSELDQAHDALNKKIDDDRLHRGKMDSAGSPEDTMELSRIISGMVAAKKIRDAKRDLKRLNIVLDESIVEKAVPIHEVSMAQSQIKVIIEHAEILENIITKLDDSDELQSWVQAKLTIANDYLSKVYNYIDHKSTHPSKKGVDNEPQV